MKKGITLVRVGGITSATSRFLDLLEDDRINNLVIIDFENNLNTLDELFRTAKFLKKGHLIDKLLIIPLKLSFTKKVLRRLSKKYKLFADLLCKTDLYKLTNMLENIKPDVIWIGDNDFDFSNLLFFLIHKLYSPNTKIVRSYKETRFVKKWDEEYMLRNADSLIFPHEKYIDFFRELYNIELRNIFFADLDWRYSKLISYVKSIEIRKLSKKDGTPHVCILTGRAYSNPSDKRSGYRYYYIPIVKELIKRGIKVHLHALKIIPDINGTNIYQKIADETEYLFIEKPLKLTIDSDDYHILKCYDAGILHPPVPCEALALQRFQELNIPNRFYEYEIADVVPLVEKGALPSVEKLILKKNYGIIYENYDDLYDKLKDLLKGNIKNRIEKEEIKSYSDFKEVLFRAIETLR